MREFRQLSIDAVHESPTNPRRVQREQNDSVHPDPGEQQRKTFRDQRGFGGILPTRTPGGSRS